jgi:MFS family permease
VAVAFFMESLDTTILNTAVPAIAAALKVAPLSMKAVLSSYTLSLAVFIPISGWMADRFGTRRVFASAIGFFTLGSFLCGISGNIHVLVACRVLQGCGGAMMVPVGRLTLVRTFAKSELIRAMSFVAIPALIGPMLGPIAGGLIVGYFHWRVIFFVNLPIGLIGLCMVYLHLPDYREKSDPLDVEGLILFGSGVALLSYVLEVFGEHTLSAGEILGLLAISIALLAGYGLHAAKAPFPFGFTPIQSGLLMTPQAIAAMSLKPAMPRILARFGYRGVLISKYDDPGFADCAVRNHRGGHAGLAHGSADVLLRFLQLAAIHQHEHAGLCRRDRGRDQQRKFHRRHHAADGDQFRSGNGVAGHRVLHSGSLPFERAANDSGNPPGVLRPGRTYRFVHYRFSRIEKRRWRSREPA